MTNNRSATALRFLFASTAVTTGPCLIYQFVDITRPSNAAAIGSGNHTTSASHRHGDLKANPLVPVANQDPAPLRQAKLRPLVNYKIKYQHSVRMRTLTILKDIKINKNKRIYIDIKYSIKKCQFQIKFIFLYLKCISVVLQIQTDLQLFISSEIFLVTLFI